MTIQHDGAAAHTSNDFELGWYDLLMKLENEGVIPEGKIVKITQPPNSPDLNVNDLGIFNSLQAAYEKKVCARDSLEIVDKVMETYDEYPWQKIDQVFLTYQAVLNEVIECHGRNDYILPHLRKRYLKDHKGKLPASIEVTQQAVALFDAMTDPEFTDMDIPIDFEDIYDEPLGGTISRQELQDLMVDIGDVPVGEAHIV